jgi:hypothetical protein
MTFLVKVERLLTKTNAQPQALRDMLAKLPPEQAGAQ